MDKKREVYGQRPALIIVVSVVSFRYAPKRNFFKKHDDFYQEKKIALLLPIPHLHIHA